MRQLALVLVAVAVVSVAGAFLHGVSADGLNCKGTPNANPIYTEAPVFVDAVHNGKLYVAGDKDDSIYLIHVWGSPYEMGYAYGQLLKQQLHDIVPTFFTYIRQQVEQQLNKFPKWLVDAVTTLGLDGALDLTFDMNRQNIPDRFVQEMQGIAAASGVDVRQIIRMNMFPELIQAACSMFGAWGEATSNTSTPGSLYQLRALDWDKYNPIKKWASVTVYHPTASNGTTDVGHAFAMVGWVGMVGTIGTGYSAADIALCEKVWITSQKIMSRFGTPWTFVLRDIFQFATNMDDALTRITNAKRTCAIHVGIGDKNTNLFRAVDYSAHQLDIYDDQNQPDYAQHPRLSNAIYWDKHVQPSSDPCMGSLMTEYYGNLDVAAAIRIASVFQTGDMHIAIYDFEQRHMLVSNAAAEGEAGPLEAYSRTFVRFDLNALFNEPQPTH